MAVVVEAVVVVAVAAVAAVAAEVGMVAVAVAVVVAVAMAVTLSRRSPRWLLFLETNGGFSGISWDHPGPVFLQAVQSSWLCEVLPVV